MHLTVNLFLLNKKSQLKAIANIIKYIQVWDTLLTPCKIPITYKSININENIYIQFVYIIYMYPRWTNII